MSIITICQPRYLPACNYVHRLLLSDVFVHMDNVKYSPCDWENRNKLKLTNGKANWITVPVIHENRNQLIADTRINNAQNWRHKHLNMLICNYSKAKYFKKYIDFFKDTYSKEWDYLEDLNLHITSFIAKEINANCLFVKASDLCVEGKGQELLINICKKVGGDTYLSGPLGRNYIEDGVFENSGIKLVYHDYNHPVYPQLHGEFLTYMSFIDLLFNCGEDSIDYLNRDNMTREQILREGAI